MNLRDIKTHVIDVAADRLGSKAEVGRRLGVKPQCFVNWQQVPPRHVLMLEQITGIDRREIRPDVYGELPRACA